MKKKRLKLNEDKTEGILIGKRNVLNNMDFKNININDVPIELSTEIKDLGVTIDNELDMQKQISNVVKAANFQLLNIAHI